MKDTQKALAWIVEILHRHNISFQISGGFAAKIYGATRELADIDIELSENAFDKIMMDVKPYIITDMHRYHDDNWDLLLMTLNYGGQEIDICGIETKQIFNQETKEWELLNSDLSKAVTQKIYEIEIPVIPREELIAYKSKLLRDVDKSDIKELV